jgi:hypothetical protein
MQTERKRLEAAVSDETIQVLEAIQALRRRIGELDQLARRLDQSGLDMRGRSFRSRASGRSWKTSSTGASDVSTDQMVRP